MKKVLFVSSESVPFIKTGGLADVVGSLPKYFDKNKYDVRVMLPKYMCMKDEWKDKLSYRLHFYMDLNIILMVRSHMVILHTILRSLHSFQKQP